MCGCVGIYSNVMYQSKNIIFFHILAMSIRKTNTESRTEATDSWGGKINIITNIGTGMLWKFNSFYLLSGVKLLWNVKLLLF